MNAESKKEEEKGSRSFEEIEDESIIEYPGKAYYKQKDWLLPAEFTEGGYYQAAQSPRVRAKRWHRNQPYTKKAERLYACNVPIDGWVVKGIAAVLFILILATIVLWLLR